MLVQVDRKLALAFPIALACHSIDSTPSSVETPPAANGLQRVQAQLVPAQYRAPAATKAEATSLREEREVVVGGVREVWRIVWRGETTPVCTPAQEFNCPCQLYSYGEMGIAELIRARPGRAKEVLRLAQAFVGGGDMIRDSSDQAVLRRWPVYPDDYETEDRAALERTVATRPLAVIMDLRDYNHDGWASEFELPVDTAGCADRRSVVIGVSRSENHLHIFSSVAAPKKPLLLQPKAWHALLSSAPGATATVVDVECDFRGAETQTELALKVAQGRIFATECEYACPKHGAPLSCSPL